MTEETPETVPGPALGYSINLSLAPQLHPDGRTRHHVILHYANAGVNLALDLGPHESTALLAESLPAGLDAAIKEARRADSGIVTAPAGALADVKHLDYGRNRLRR